MSRSLKIILAVLILISIAFSLAVVFGWNPFQRIKAKLSSESVPASLVEEETPADLSGYPALKEMSAEDRSTLARPVDEKYFESALLNEENPQVLSFFLEPEESIKAIFKGTVREVFKDEKPYLNDNAFDEIFLDREDGQFCGNYVIYGEVLVSKGETVEEGEVIAKAKEGGLGFRSMTNFSLWIHDNTTNEFMELSKEMFAK